MTTKQLPELNAYLDTHQLEALASPAEQARGLPGACYGNDFYALEQRDLFPRTWAAIAFGADVPEPGDLYPTELAGHPLVVVRQQDASIRVFSNICRHRGMTVVSAPCSKARQLTCPWHAWTYELDGRLRATPRLGGERVHESEGFEKSELGLKEVRCAVWHDLVLVNLDGQATAFEKHIAPLEALFEGIDLAGLKPGGQWEGIYPGNWKTAIEGAVEDYHLPMGHPQLCQGVKSRPVHIDFAGRCFVSTRSVIEFFVPSELAASMGDFPQMRAAPEKAEHNYVVNLFPTAVMTVDRLGWFLGIWTPDGPERTRIRFRYYAPADAFGTLELDRQRQRFMDGLAEVVMQDHDFVAAVQRNVFARDAAGIDTRFSPYWEPAVLEFQRLVVDVMSDSTGS